jgi:hypothetical protein
LGATKARADGADKFQSKGVIGDRRYAKSIAAVAMAGA